MLQDARTLHIAVGRGSVSTVAARASTGFQEMTAASLISQSILSVDISATLTRVFVGPTEFRVWSATGGVSVEMDTGVQPARASSVKIGVITMACASILMFAAAFVGTQVTDANTTAAVMAMGSVTKRAHARVTMAGGGVQAVRRVSGIAVVMSASGLGSAGARPARRALASRAGVCAGLDLPGMTVHRQSPNPTMALRSE